MAIIVFRTSKGTPYIMGRRVELSMDVVTCIGFHLSINKVIDDQVFSKCGQLVTEILNNITGGDWGGGIL